LVVTYTIIDGGSMAPTINHGERYFVHRWAIRVQPLQRGDIAAIQLPHYEDLTVKRIVALPYERVQIRDGKVLVNDKPLPESYLSRSARTGSGPLGKGVFRVEHDCYFVLGDNRDKSIDSRFFGAVHKDCIIGVVFE
jgi:signal peptidase I